MNGWTAALLAGGLFLAFYSIFLLTRKKEGGDTDRKLGSGFIFLAAIVWGLAFGRLLDDLALGMQLGLSLALLLPAVSMLLNPRRRGVLFSMALLMVAVGVGVPAVGQLWERLKNVAQPGQADEIEAALDRVSRQIGESDAQLVQLQRDRQQVERELREFGYSSLEALEANREAALRLDELAEIDQLQDLLGDHLALLRNKREQLEVGLRRARRLEGTESAAGENLLDIDVEAIMREIELSSREPSRAVTVEEHIERQRKQALLDETMQ